MRPGREPLAGWPAALRQGTTDLNNINWTRSGTEDFLELRSSQGPEALAALQRLNPYGCLVRIRLAGAASIETTGAQKVDTMKHQVNDRFRSNGIGIGANQRSYPGWSHPEDPTAPFCSVPTVVNRTLKKRSSIHVRSGVFLLTKSLNGCPPISSYFSGDLLQVSIAQFARIASKIGSRSEVA